MSITMTKVQLPTKAKRLPALTDYPDLALAAATTTAPLDLGGLEFRLLQSALETLSRLKLGVNNTLALMLLARHGPLRMGALTKLLRITTASGTGLAQRMQHLGLVTARRSDGHDTDRREIVVTITEGGRRVLASVTALAALGAAAAALHSN